MEDKIMAKNNELLEAVKYIRTGKKYQQRDFT